MLSLKVLKQVVCSTWALQEFTGQTITSLIDFQESFNECKMFVVSQT